MSNSIGVEKKTTQKQIQDKQQLILSLWLMWHFQFKKKISRVTRKTFAASFSDCLPITLIQIFPSSAKRNRYWRGSICNSQ